MSKNNKITQDNSTEEGNFKTSLQRIPTSPTNKKEADELNRSSVLWQSLVFSVIYLFSFPSTFIYITLLLQINQMHYIKPNITNRNINKFKLYNNRCKRRPSNCKRFILIPQIQHIPGRKFCMGTPQCLNRNLNVICHSGRNNCLSTTIIYGKLVPIQRGVEKMNSIADPR
jgi:hypothetical protein